MHEKLESAEERAYSDPSNDLVRWGCEELDAACREAGARHLGVETEQSIDTRRITEREMNLWLAPDSSYGKALASAFSTGEIEQVHNALRSQLLGRETSWTSTIAFVVARK